MFISAANAQETTKQATTDNAVVHTDTQQARQEAVTLSTDEAAPYELSSDKMLSDTLIFLFLLFAIFYFLLIRPQQKRFKQHKEMISAIGKGAKIITGGGMVGTVIKEEDEEFILVEIAQGVRVSIAKSSVGSVMGEGESSSKTANDNKK